MRLFGRQSEDYLSVQAHKLGSISHLMRNEDQLLFILNFIATFTSAYEIMCERLGIGK